MATVLIGYMASGKSSIGKKLAKKLNLSFIDLDESISEREAMSIPAIFRTKGEIYFRKIEAALLSELLQVEDDFILAVGGGTPCYGNNMETITKNATSFYLRATIQTIYNKLIKQKNKHKRPLISTIANDDLKEFIAKHLFERSQYYEQATATISIDDKTKKEIVTEISLNMQ